jgi:ribonuclease-3 family protein
MEPLYHPPIDREQMLTFSSLALAHMGDAVYEIMVRAELCAQHNLTNKVLHQKTVELVCAKSQAKAARHMKPVLTETEQDVFSRARNTRPNNIPKAESAGDYSLATALEAVFGYLYLNGENERINELFKLCKETFTEA